MANKTDDTRVKAMELAIQGGFGSQTIEMATSIYAFLTGASGSNAGSGAAGSNDVRPTPTPTPTPTLAAAAGEQASGGDTGSAAPDTSTAQNGTGGAGTSPSGPFDVKALQAKCQAHAAKNGAPALLAEFQKVGASKWSEVKVDQYPTLMANLEAAG